METNKCKVLIIGSGPAGYTAGIYTSRAMLAPVLYTGMQPGGQLTTTINIENYPGFPEGRGCYELMEDMRKQAERFGTTIKEGSVVSLDTTVYPFVALTDGGERLEAESIIIATGASARYLPLLEMDKYIGMGVSACATCDGFFYRGKVVGVVGGGDTAAEEARYLAGLAQKVYLIVRRDDLRATKVMKAKLAECDNIEVLYQSQVVALRGAEYLEAVVVRSADGEREIAMDGLFMAIGREPNTSLFPTIQTDADGYIIKQAGSTMTNIEGIFACGDVCDPIYRQAITAAADGCKAAKDVERWLGSKE